MTDSEIVSKLMAIMPHGYTPTHTRDNLPDRVSWIISDWARQELVIDRLEKILTEHGIPFPEHF